MPTQPKLGRDDKIRLLVDLQPAKEGEVGRRLGKVKYRSVGRSPQPFGDQQRIGRGAKKLVHPKYIPETAQANVKTIISVRHRQNAKRRPGDEFLTTT